MATYIALLRAVNVGGVGKLPMSALVELCAECGFSRVRTYIASGNVIFDANQTEPECLVILKAALQSWCGKPIGVQIRTQASLRAVLDANPFKGEAPDRVLVTFLDAPPPDILVGVSGRKDETIHAGRREIYVHYPNGQGATKLRLPAARTGTARNLNTLAKLVELAG